VADTSDRGGGGCRSPRGDPVRGLWRAAKLLPPEPGRASPIADFTTLPFTVALFRPGCGAAFLRLAAPAALGPSCPRWRPGGALPRPAVGRGTGLLTPYAGNTPLPDPAPPGPRGPTRRLQQLQAPPQQGGRHARAPRAGGQLPPVRDATSVTAAPHFRRRAGPDAHAQRELRAGVGREGPWRHVVAPCCGAML